MVATTPVTHESCDKNYIPEPIMQEVHEKGHSHIIKETPSELGYNCVSFAKSKRPDLPQGLFSLADKKKIIKTKTPYVGAIGVTAEGGNSGHLIVVDQILKDTLIVSDSNYRTGFITKRIISLSSVLGYF